MMVYSLIKKYQCGIDKRMISHSKIDGAAVVLSVGGTEVLQDFLHLWPGSCSAPWTTCDPGDDRDLMRWINLAGFSRSKFCSSQSAGTPVAKGVNRLICSVFQADVYNSPIAADV